MTVYIVFRYRDKYIGTIDERIEVREVDGVYLDEEYAQAQAQACNGEFEAWLVF